MLHVVLYLGNGLDDKLVQVFNVNSFFRIFFQLKLGVDTFGKKVSNLLVVDFEVRASNQKLLPHIRRVVKIAENVVERIGNDTLETRLIPLSNHGMRLAATSLSIRKNGAIVTAHHRLN